VSGHGPAGDQGASTAPREQPRPQTSQTAGPRSRKGVETRARLLDAAKHVFEELGYLEARVSDIGERAGLSHGSFYHYFDSKEQIFREVADAQEALLTAPADDDERVTGGADGSELDRLQRANRRYLERYRDNGRIMGVIEEVSRYDQHVGEARMRRQKHFADRAERSIRRLQQAGKADRSVDPGIAALALGSMVARVAELWLIEGWADYDLDDVARQLTLLWANAIGLDEPGPPGAPEDGLPARAMPSSSSAMSRTTAPGSGKIGPPGVGSGAIVGGGR
jgi:AcrR family transcriptional regulator